MCMCVCSILDQFVPVSVWEAVFNVGSWKYSSCCRERERDRERIKEKRRLHKKERLREVPAQAPSVQGLSSCRVKAPIERKQGHLNSAAASHTQTHTPSHTCWSRTTPGPA